MSRVGKGRITKKCEVEKSRSREKHWIQEDCSVEPGLTREAGSIKCCKAPKNCIIESRGGNGCLTEVELDQRGAGEVQSDVWPEPLLDCGFDRAGVLAGLARGKAKVVG